MWLHKTAMLNCKGHVVSTGNMDRREGSTHNSNDKIITENYLTLGIVYN